MSLRTLEARMTRLEAKRGTGRFDGLPYDQIEHLLFNRLHRLASAVGGIDELMTDWDSTNDPEERSLITRVRSHVRNVRGSYLEMEARLCPRH